MQSSSITVNINENRQSFKAKLIKLDSDGILLEFLNHPSYANLSSGTCVQVIMQEKNNNILMYSGEISEVVQNQIKITNLKLISNIDRRNDMKTKLEQKCIIVSSKNEKGKSFIIDLIDISAGGIGFNSPLKLDLSDIYEIILNLNFNSVLLTLQILREDINPKDNTFFYGCQFKNITPRDDEIIRRYVFENESKTSKK